MKTNIIKTLLLSAVVLSTSLYKTASAQSHDIAVATGNTFLLGEMNPASQMRSSYLVFPFFGNFGLSVTSPISVNKAITTKDGGNYLNARNITSSLSNKALNIGLNMDIISFGVRINKDQMLTFSTKLKVGGDMMLPGEAVGFLTANPLTALNSYNLNLGSDVMAYGEAAIGYSYRVWDNLTVGARFKYLAGMAYVGSDSRAQLILRDDATYDVRGDVDIRVVGAGLEKGNETFGVGVNNGFAFDFGAEYMFDFGLKVGLSMTDIGFINWNQGERTQIVSRDPNASYHFIGVEDMGQYLEAGTNFSKGLKKLGDDLLDAMQLDTIVNEMAFKSKLVSKLNIYGSYAIDNAKRHNVSLNMITRFNPSVTLKNDFSTTVGYTYCNKRDRFRALAAYTISTRLGSKFSAGIVTEGRSGEFYFLVDANPIFGAYNTRSVGFRLGGVFYLGNKNYANK